MSNDFLEHYGVKGMKWGITTKSDGAKRSSVSKVASSLSDDDLKAKVKRLNMEQQYVSLTNKANKRNRSSMKKGSDEVKNFLETIGKAKLTPIISTGLGVVGTAIAIKLSGEAGKAFTSRIKPIGR